MHMFVRTLHKSTAVSAACSVLVDCVESGMQVPWMCICRPRGCVELWCETDGRLVSRGSVEIGEAVQLVPLPPQLPGFLAIDAEAQLTLVTLHKGDTNGAIPIVRERTSMDLTDDRCWADVRKVDGVVCSQAIFLHSVPGSGSLDSMVQHSSIALPPGTAPKPGPATAAAHSALEAATRAYSHLSAPPADVDALDSDIDVDAPSFRQLDPSAAEVNGLNDDLQAAQGPTAATLAPETARYVTVVYIGRGFLDCLEIFAGSEVGLTSHLVPIPPLPVDDRISGNDGKDDEVLAMQLLRRKEKGSRVVVDLIMLCSAIGGTRTERPQHYLRLVRMRFDSRLPSAGPAINWRVASPFFNRVVDPTASLLQAAGESLLTISQRQVLIHTRGLMGELTCNLPAAPMTAVLALPNLHIVADASGGLYILDSSGSQHSWRVRPIRSGSQLSVAVALCFVPARTTDTPHAGWLFLGSHTGNSQILAAPRRLSEELTAGMPISDAALHWQVVDPHAIDNLAPVQDQLAFEHPPGSGEQRLALCCGAAPSGALRIASTGVGLLPRAHFDMGVVVRPSLWAVRDSTGSWPQYLVLSSELVGATSLLEVTGLQVQPAGPISSLRLDVPTLLIAPVQECVMLQVTTQHVWAMPLPRACGPVRCWEPPIGSGPITTAASHGCHVVLACGRQLVYLQILLQQETAQDEMLHELTHVRTVSATQQVAVVTVFEAQGCVYAVVGTWVSNEVDLLPLQHTGAADDASQSSAADEGDTAALLPLLWLPNGTPRSLLVRHFGPGGLPTLVVGSSSGEVIFCTLDIGSASSRVAVGTGRVVQVGLAEVQLVSLPAGILAVSDQAVLLRSDPEYKASSAETTDQQSGPLRTINVQRVHANEAVIAAAGLGCAAMPNMLAWLADQDLILGKLDPKVQLRWQTAPIGDTPLHIEMLPSSGTLLVATQSADSTELLRLFQPITLQQVAEVQLRQGQQHTALHALQVPLLPECSKPAATAGDSMSGAAPAQRSTAASPAVAHRSAEALDLAIVAHHESATSLQQAAAAGRGYAPQALSSWLSFFTVQHLPHEDAARDKYELQLVGKQHTPSICHAITVLQAGSNGSEPCQLAVACHASLQVHALQVSTNSSTDGSLYTVSLQRLYEIEGGLGCIVMLRALGGGELVVGSLLGSVIVCGPDVTSAPSEAAAKWAAAYHAPSDIDMTKGADPESSDPPLLGSPGHHSSDDPMEWLQSEAPPQQLRLRPRSADVSGLYAMDCLPLSHDRFLVAAHPSGLLVMRRYRELEAEAEAEAARYMQQAAEAGQQRGPDGDAGPEVQPNLVPLGPEAGCRTQHNIVGLIHGRLGVPIKVLPAHCCSRDHMTITLGRDGSTDPCLRHPDSYDHRECALFVSRDGAVGLIEEVTPHQYEVLYQAQLSARYQRAGCQSDLDVSGHQRAWTLHSHDEDEMTSGLGNFIDGDLLATELRRLPADGS